jgi:hypothetical protein
MSVRHGDSTDEVGLSANALSRLSHLVGFVDVDSRDPGAIAIGHGLKPRARYLSRRAIRVGIWPLGFRRAQRGGQWGV